MRCDFVANDNYVYCCILLYILYLFCIYAFSLVQTTFITFLIYYISFIVPFYLWNCSFIEHENCSREF